MIGAELLLKCLEEENVEMVFGIPGGVLLPLYNVLKKSKIKHILTRHEQGAAHCADGYARASNKVGVCFATSGPGATNLLTGITTAQMDSSPIVAITGQVGSSYLGKDSFQEADTTGLTQPITKHNYLVKDANQLPSIIKEAFYIASHGRPGPVLVDITKDVLTQEISPDIQGHIRPRIEKKLAKPVIPEKQITRVVELVRDSNKPLIFAGGGMGVEASEFLQKIAIENEIPVAVTLMGKGSFPANHPLYLGMVGMHGTTQANWAIQNCDCLLAIGVRFDDRVTGELATFAPSAKIIHVDIDAAEIGKNCPVEVPIVGDSADFLKEFSERIFKPKNTKEWLEKIENNKVINKTISNNFINPENLLAEIDSLLDKDTIIVTDVGQHQMWAALFLNPRRPKSFLTSGGLGTMGFGLPAAIGAQFANPEKKIILITGDGSLQMNIQELAVIKQFALPIKIVLLNNGCLGMVRQWQELFFDANYAESSLETGPDWEKLAAAYGIKGKNIKDEKEKEKYLQKALEDDAPCLLNIQVDPRANVFPIVPAGASIDEMWGRWDDETHLSSLG